MSYPYQISSLEEYHQAYKKSIENPEEFWSEVAVNFIWKKKWDKVLEWNFKEPDVKGICADLAVAAKTIMMVIKTAIPPCCS